MPKLRDRKTLSAPVQYTRCAESDASGAQSRTDNWTRDETKTLLAAVRQHGTRDVQKLADAVGTRSKASIERHLRNVRGYRTKSVPEEQQATPLDDWLNIVHLASPEEEFRHCVDQTAMATPLLLAADEEDRLATAEHRASLAGVYRFLADVASGAMPAEPSESDACRLVALTHHLAVLLKTINLSRHKRWLWSSQLLRKLAAGDLEIAGTPAPAPDLSLVPTALRPLIGRLLGPSTNPLRTSAALVINPLATQLNVEASGSDHLLLDDPERLWERLLTTARGEETDEREVRQTVGVPAGSGPFDSAPLTTPASGAGAPSTSAAGSPVPPTAGGSTPAANTSAAPDHTKPRPPPPLTSAAPDHTKPRPPPPLKMAPGGWIQSRKSKHQERLSKTGTELVSTATASYSENGGVDRPQAGQRRQERPRVPRESPDTEQEFISVSRKFPSRGRVRTYGKPK